MTDKQIIINGIDVSGCDFLAQKDNYCSYSGITYAYKGQCMCSDEEMCKDHPKCFYKKVLKQLKRKEQECEELKFQNKRLNELASYWHKRFFEVGRSELKLKQTLTEIKEFFNEECIICKENYINITGEICEECKYKDILQKISEVEE